MNTAIDVLTMDSDYTKFAYDLEFLKETNRSIYAKSPVYGWVYRIEKKSRFVFRDGKQIARTCTYTVK